jgi:hypothetical protein
MKWALIVAQMFSLILPVRATSCLQGIEHSHSRISEATQIRLVLDGNDEAFCDLVKPHRRDLYLKALSIVRNEADAEEVAQNAVRKAFSKLSQFRFDSQFRT